MEKKYAAILISDLNGFTEFSRKVSPDKLYNLLKNYFYLMGSVITANDGKVVKTMGDGILCYFSLGDELQKRKESVFKSIKAAIEMKRVCTYLNCRQEGENNKKSACQLKLPEIDARIAIHSGFIGIGTVIEDVVDVLGSHVNLASRMINKIGKSKQFDVEPIKITDVAKELIADKIILHSDLEKMTDIKGFGDLNITLFEPINYGEIAYSKTLEPHGIENTKMDLSDNIIFFPNSIESNDNLYVEYYLDESEYKDSKIVLVQLPLLATVKGRRGDSEVWKTTYFININGEYIKIAGTEGMVFDEPKAFQYAPCIDLKLLEERGIFSFNGLKNHKLRVFPTLWNDGSEQFWIQRHDSHRLRRVYPGIVYIK